MIHAEIAVLGCGMNFDMEKLSWVESIETYRKSNFDTEKKWWDS